MNGKTNTLTRTDTDLASIAFCAIAGLMLLLPVGFAQATVLHDGAHDTRHAVAFPCH